MCTDQNVYVCVFSLRPLVPGVCLIARGGLMERTMFGWNFSHDALPSLLDAFLAVTGSAESIGFSVRVCVFLRSFVEREREEFPKQIRGCDGLMMQLTEGKIHRWMIDWKKLEHRKHGVINSMSVNIVRYRIPKLINGQCGTAGELNEYKNGFQVFCPKVCNDFMQQNAAHAILFNVLYRE